MTIHRDIGTRRWMCVAVLFSALAAHAGDRDPAVRLIGAALTGSRAYEKLAYLTDRVGHRLSGSAGYDAATKWAVDQFQRDGIDRAWTERVMVPRWARGEERSQIVSPIVAAMATTALGMSDPTPDGGITAEVIEVQSLDELKAAGEKAKGKIVLFNRPVLRDGGPDYGYGAGATLRHRGAVEAAKLGAVGTLLRSLGTASFRLPHTGGMDYEEGVPRIPSAAISAEDADLIHRLLTSGDPVRVHLELGCRTLPDVEQANVVAEIRGRGKPEEIVLIGGHLDSWDLGQGAIDDGAGCAIVMETMRIIEASGMRPRRTIRAVLFANEENGLRGGRAYAEAHKVELERHVAAIEVDSGGGKPSGFGVTAGAGGIEMVRKLVAPLATLDASQVTEGGGGADISPMKPARVPMLLLRQETSNYFDYHHSAADTLDKVDRRDLDKCVAALATLTYALADSEEPLPRP